MKDCSLNTIEKQQLKTGLQLLERQSFLVNKSGGGGSCFTHAQTYL